jgi:hypothetical protein
MRTDPAQPPACERRPLDQARVRKLPAHFAWAEHALRDRLAGLTLEEIALLFFLHLAADRNGCCFWADATLARRLNLKEGDLIQARYGLMHKGFVLYRFPLYQLLPVDSPKDAPGAEASR